MGKPKRACYKCDKRHPGCHGTCGNYYEDDKALADKKTAIAEGRSQEKIYTDYHAEMVAKTKKKFNHK